MKKTNINRNIPLLVLVIILAILAVVTSIGTWRAANRPQKNESLLHDPLSIYAFKYSENMLSLDVGSPQVFVYDVSNDTVIYSKGQDKVIYPGSTTKLLTALFSLEILSPDEIITPGNELELVKKDSSVAFIKSYHRLTVEMLIEAMMIPSGNDAAYVLAAAAGKKLAEDEDLEGKTAVGVFMNGLRDYATEIGLCGTSLTVPDGYDGREHYTTTEDMILVSKLVLENELIMRYTSKPKASVVYASGHTNEWKNTNKLLDKESAFYSKYVTGLKTGTVDGECSLVISIEFDDGRSYIAGVFGSPDKNTRFYDALKIIDELNR